jgi:hypothetical protein
VLGYLVDGDIGRWADDLKARGQGCLILWRHEALARLWTENRDAIFAEATRRNLKVPFAASDFDAFAPGARS